MARSILIPTDLSVNSLKTLKHALNESGPEALNIMLVFPYMQPTGIGELLFYSPSKTLRSLQSDDFKDALEVLRNRYENKVASLRVELFQGRTQRALDDLLQVNNVQEIHLPEEHVKLIHPQGFDIMPMLQASAVRKQVHHWEPAPMHLSEDRLQVLFHQ